MTPSSDGRLPVGRLDDHFVLITSAASGLGRGCAERCLMAGARLVLVDRDRSSLEQAELDLRSSGDVMSAVADVTDEGELAEAVEAAKIWGGALDGTIVNAGAPGEGSATDLHPDDWERVMAVNSRAPG